MAASRMTRRLVVGITIPGGRGSVISLAISIAAVVVVRRAVIPLRKIAEGFPAVSRTPMITVRLVMVLIVRIVAVVVVVIIRFPLVVGVVITAIEMIWVTGLRVVVTSVNTCQP